MRQWRLIYDHPLLGGANMARDMAILQSVAAGDAPITLRLYDWQPACLSLGYAQNAHEADFQRMAERGWVSVRRPTGGKAILHCDELTYSLALPETDAIAEGGIVESYRRISAALAAGLLHLGVHSQADAQAERLQSGAVCFEVPSHYEITAAGRKLIGSAQVRRHDGVLQHGSLPLVGDMARICDALVYPDEAARTAAKEQVRARATTVERVLGRAVSWAEAATALVAGFQEVFAVDFAVGELTDAEREQAAMLEAESYGTEAWTRRR